VPTIAVGEYGDVPETGYLTLALRKKFNFSLILVGNGSFHVGSMMGLLLKAGTT